MDARKVARRHVGPWAPGLLVAVALGTGCLGGFLRMRRVPLGEALEVWLGGGGNSGVLLHGREALVVDAKVGGYTRRMDHHVEQELQRTVRRMVITHSHGDHAGGLSAFEGLGAALVHPRAKARLLAQPPSGTPPSVPYVEVEEALQLQLGDEQVQIIHPGVAHTDGDLVALLPSRGVLFAGDLVLEGYEPRVDVAAGGSVLAFRATLERLLQLPFETVVPGHGEITGRRWVEHYRDYFAALEAEVGARLAQGRSEDETVREVTLPAFADLKPLPLGMSSREKTVRLMYKALQRP